MTALWVSMAIHLASFVFWVVLTLYTTYKLKREFREKGETLQKVYDDARAELEANIENVKKMAHEANTQFLRNMYTKSGG